jgi:hypothetical protein
MEEKDFHEEKLLVGQANGKVQSFAKIKIFSCAKPEIFLHPVLHEFFYGSSKLF